MTRDKHTLILTLIHIVVISCIAFFSWTTLKKEQSAFIHELAERMYNVTGTTAALTGEGIAMNLIEQKGDISSELRLGADRLRITFKEILTNSNMEESELSLIVKKESGTEQWYRLVSSDEVYAHGELYVSEYTGTMQASSELIKMSPSIWKLVAMAPINGDSEAFIRLSSPNLKAQADSFLPYWYVLSPIALYALFAIFLTPFILRTFKRLRTEQKNKNLYEELQQKSTELKMLSLVAKKSENLMLITDERGQIMWVNETYEMKNNYTAEELNQFVGKYLQDVSKNEHIHTLIKNVVDFKKALTYESSSTGKDGQMYFAMTTVTPVIGDTGSITNLLFVDTDVTRLKRAQKENEVYREFANKSIYPRIHVSSQGEIMFYNPAATSIVKEWRGKDGNLRSDMLAMVQAISDSGMSQDLSIDTLGTQIKLSFHPDREKNGIYILGEAMIHHEEWHEPQSQKKAG